MNSSTVSWIRCSICIYMFMYLNIHILRPLTPRSMFFKVEPRVVVQETVQTKASWATSPHVVFSFIIYSPFKFCRLCTRDYYSLIMVKIRLCKQCSVCVCICCGSKTASRQSGAAWAAVATSDSWTDCSLFAHHVGPNGYWFVCQYAVSHLSMIQHFLNFGWLCYVVVGTPGPVFMARSFDLVWRFRHVELSVILTLSGWKNVKKILS